MGQGPLERILGRFPHLQSGSQVSITDLCGPHVIIGLIDIYGLFPEGFGLLVSEAAWTLFREPGNEETLLREVI